MEVEFRDGTTLCLREQIIREANKRIESLGFLRESGGILLGRQFLQEEAYELDKMTYPGKRDIRRRFWFIRSKESANSIIRKTWLDSGGEQNYIGEWHTHNEAVPRPSSEDRRLLKSVVLDASCPLDRVFMIIVGNAGKVFIGMAYADGSGE